MKQVKRIISIPDGMTWKEFAVKYDKFFPISNESARIEKLKREYTRLTGKNPDRPVETVKRSKKNVGTQELYSQNPENNDQSARGGITGNSEQ